MNSEIDSRKAMVVCFGLAALTTLSGYAIYSDGLKSPKVYQQNVVGNEKPETYVEVNGVKYYSHVDGKDISDLVKE